MARLGWSKKVSSVLLGALVFAGAVTVCTDAYSQATRNAPWIPGLPVPVLLPPGMPGSVLGPGGNNPNIPGPGPTTVPTNPSAGPGIAPGSVDGNGMLTLQYETSRSAQILNELVAALRADRKAKVQGIPLAPDMQTSDVNAYAGCENGAAFMAITGPLLKAMGHIAEAKAADDVFGGSKLNTYYKMTADSLAGGAGVPDPPAGFYTPAESNDQRKLLRQRDLFDEMVAFVLGHELAHHYLGHTGCANGTVSGQIDPAKLGRITSNVIPGFNQINESAADTSGTQNLLDAGAIRTPAVGNALSEQGAILVLQFFAALSSFRPEVIFLGFMRTHPPPQLRIPMVQSTAQQWRQGIGKGGNSSIPLPIPLPFPIPGM